MPKMSSGAAKSLKSCLLCSQNPHTHIKCLFSFVFAQNHIVTGNVHSYKSYMERLHIQMSTELFHALLGSIFAKSTWFRSSQMSVAPFLHNLEFLYICPVLRTAAHNTKTLRLTSCLWRDPASRVPILDVCSKSKRGLYGILLKSTNTYTVVCWDVR